MRVRQSAGMTKRKLYKKKAPSPRGQILQRKFFINLNFMNKIYSCALKDSVINLYSLNGFFVTCRGMIYKYFFSEIKINSLTSVSLVGHELSVSLYELDEFFKISL